MSRSPRRTGVPYDLFVPRCSLSAPGESPRPGLIPVVALLAATMVLAVAAAASATTVATGEMTVCYPALTVALTFDDATYDAHGIPVNLGTSVGSMQGTLSSLASVPAGKLALAMNGGYWQPPNETFYVIRNPVTTVGGTVAATLPALAWLLEAKVSPGGPPGCYVGRAVLAGYLPQATPTGTNVGVAASATFEDLRDGATRSVDVTVVFPSVNAAGTTTVTGVPSYVTADVPARTLWGRVSGFSGTAVEIGSTATFGGSPTVCVHWVDADGDGVVDGTTLPEAALRLLRQNGGNWLDVTAPPVDAAANRACGVVPALGTFTLGATDGFSAPTPRAVVTNPTGDVNDAYGSDLATGSGRVLVGAGWAQASGIRSGAAYLHDAATGALLRVFNDPTPLAFGAFGSRVLIDGDNVLVAVTSRSEVFPGQKDNAGEVHHFDGNTGALLRTFVQPGGPVVNAVFGRGLATVGSHVVIGASGDSLNATSAGAVYVFDLQTGALVCQFHGTVPYEGIGAQLAVVSGRVVAFGSSSVYVIDPDTGAATVVSLPAGYGVYATAAGGLLASSKLGWSYGLFDPLAGTLVRTLGQPLPTPTSRSEIVSLAGSTRSLVAGHRDHDVGQQNAGIVYRVDLTTGRLLRAFQAPSPTPDEGFGSRVATDGRILSVLAVNSRTIYVYDLALCGDGVADVAEACDDGNANDHDACTGVCEAATCGDGVVWTGHEQCDDGNTVAGDGCEPITCTLTPEAASGTPNVGDFVTTDGEADGATPSDPVETTVTTPNAGIISISETAAPPSPPAGYFAVGALVQITAPAASACTPLAIAFRIDASLIPFGQDTDTLAVFRNGAALPNCTAGPPACIAPTPACIVERTTLADGDVQMTALAVAASDWFVAAGGTCGDGIVSGSEQCDTGNPTAGDCCSATCQLEAPTAVCRPAADACDLAETCTGTSPTCPDDARAAEGSSCDDGDACTTGETCTGSSCGGGSETMCGPCEVCTPASGCGLPAAPGCQAALAGKASLLLKHASNPDKDRAVWKWVSSAAVLPSDLGDPTATTGYELCVLDDDAGTARLRVGVRLPAAGVCAGNPCWRAMGTTGFRYVDKELTPDGVQAAVLKSGSAAGKGKFTVKAKGPAVELPHAPLSAPVTVRLRRTDGAACWEARYSHPTVNDASQLKAKGD